MILICHLAEMCKCYIQIENEIKSIPVMVEFLPSATQTLCFKESLVHLSSFQSITKKQQTTVINIYESLDIFDSMLESYILQ
jgi:hypothetical protein